MLAAAEKAHADNLDQTSSFSYSPELLKKYDAIKSNVKYSPVLKVVFDINPKVWKQETRTLTPEETIDVAGHKIKVKLELTPFTTVTTLSSDEALFKKTESLWRPSIWNITHRYWSRTEPVIINRKKELLPIPMQTMR
ncbi:hypothetical protein ACFSQ7_01185 [Paenibacillus rhizoplanae]